MRHSDKSTNHKPQSKRSRDMSFRQTAVGSTTITLVALSHRACSAGYHFNWVSVEQINDNNNDDNRSRNDVDSRHHSRPTLSFLTGKASPVERGCFCNTKWSSHLRHPKPSS